MRSCAWSIPRRAYSTDQPSTPGGGQQPGSSPEVLRLSLVQALDRLVDAAVAKVEAGDLPDAIAILQEGIAEFAPKFPGTPEVGELHNQTSLLLYAAKRPDEAAHHAQQALDITTQHFGPDNMLTGHRQLRLGTAKFAQGRLGEAAELLQKAAKSLVEDPSIHEVEVYQDLVRLASASDVLQVKDLEGSLVRNVRAMRDKFGAESMVLSLAITQHDRIATNSAAPQQVNLRLVEELFKQHTKLLEEVNPHSEDVAISNYKLATFLYSSGMLQDANAYIRKSAELLRRLYPEEHDLVVLCKHRMGMVCAASGDHRSATQLLSLSRGHYLKQQDTHSLAREADVGLALARFRALDHTREPLPKREQALAEVRQAVEALMKAVGENHMLTQAAAHHYADASAKLHGKSA